MFQSVIDFQTAFGQRVGEYPEFPDTNERQMRINFSKYTNTYLFSVCI